MSAKKKRVEDIFRNFSDHNEPMPPLQSYEARDGGQLKYRSYESQNKNNIIVLYHGSSAHGKYLHHLAKHLSEVRKLGQVLVPNLRGHYESGIPQGDCAYIGQLEDDFEDLIRSQNLLDKKIFVIGHSSGGGLAIRMAGGSCGKMIHGYVLLSPAIPTAPTMRNGNAGGWAKVSLLKIITLSILNAIGIRCFNHSHVISFNKPKEYCDGTETLSYSYNLNCSYHPRLPYALDLAAIKDKFILIVGQEDEANDPLQYAKIMPSSETALHIIEGAKHLNIVWNEKAMKLIADWIDEKEKI